jgi:hypothetical protein
VRRLAAGLVFLRRDHEAPAVMNVCLPLADGSLFRPTPQDAETMVRILSVRIAHVPEADQGALHREIEWWKARQDPMNDYAEWGQG